jgi:hypothetical protein
MDKFQTAAALTVIYNCQNALKQDNPPICIHKIHRKLKCAGNESTHIHTQSKSDFYPASTQLNRMPDNWQATLWGTNASEPF